MEACSGTAAYEIVMPDDPPKLVQNPATRPPHPQRTAKRGGCQGSQDESGDLNPR